MRYKQNLAIVNMLLILGGCATLPTGPSVNVLPAQGKSFDAFQAEDATCRQWAEKQMGMATQDSYDKSVGTGAVAGTAIGAGLGAALGSASGHAGAGAAIGAATGLLFGTAAGSDSGRVSARESQRRYDNAYVQCMYADGNQVPGYRPRVEAAPPRPVVAAPPPPPPAIMAQTDVPPLDAPAPPPEMAPDPGMYPAPQEVYFETAPQFIYSPALNLYVAVGVPYDLVYTGSEYFYFYGGRWYRGPFYNGPWVLAARRYFPPVLLRFGIANIRYYRDAEFKRYQHDGAHYAGRMHRPEFRGNARKVEHN